MERFVLSLLLCLTVTSALATSVRLVGGSSSNQGRVEVLYNGKWGTVCDDRWDDVDARVVCQELGLGDSGIAFSHATFGQGTGDIILANLACTGYETDLFSCPANPPLHHNCEHSEDAGVKCSSTKRNEVFELDEKKEEQKKEVLSALAELLARLENK